MRTLTEEERISVEDVILAKHLKLTETAGFNYIGNNFYILDSKARIFIQVLLCDASENLSLRIKLEIPNANLAMKQHHCNTLALLAAHFDANGRLIRNEFYCS